MGKIRIDDTIDGLWSRVRSSDVVHKIDSTPEGDKIAAHINSPGGDVFGAVQIYNALKQHDGPVHVIVDALAASAASIVAMAGDRITMSSGAMMMIHNPWTITAGDASQHRDSAAMLDAVRASMIDVYEQRTGRSRAELRTMLDETTWMGAQDAVDEGFADDTAAASGPDTAAAMLLGADFTGQPAAKSDDFSTIKPDNFPAGLRDRVAACAQSRVATVVASTHPKGDKMPRKKKESHKQASDDSQPTEAAIDQEALDQARAEAREQARAEERQRYADIRKACQAARFGDDVVDEYVAGDMSIDAIRADVLERLAKKDEEGHISGVNPGASISVGIGEVDKFNDAAMNNIMARIGEEDRDPQNHLSSYSLVELCRASARMHGIDVVGLGRKQMVGKVLASAGRTTSSDFPHLLKDAAHKQMLKGYSENNETFPNWTRKANLSDFKIVNLVNLNLFDELLEVPEGGKYQKGQIGDSGETVQLAEYGRTFTLSRRAIINDDLNALTMVPRRMGEAAARTLGTLAAHVLIDNPKMADGNNLFSAQHSNSDTGSALGIDTIQAGFDAMAEQTDPDGKTKNGLNIEPSIMLVPTALRWTAQELMQAKNVPDTTDKPNTVRGLLDIYVDGRLQTDDPARWYMLADPNRYDTIVAGYLNGNSTPMMERESPFGRSGVDYLIGIDCVFAAIGWRTMYRAKG
ncbi:MAG TPA: ClpP-like prohead protease/major capsid protein fusion protein [Alphaproteobacteria bacterium]|nr:ClpP-like prohead protease/major capsid protein fusion protein [Alphaproteobacteria bacterium]